MAKPRSRSGRGHGQWGWQHQQERAKWAPVVEAGEAHCVEPICLMATRWIPPGTPWHLSHDPTGTIWLGPSHRRCNLSEAAIRGNKTRGKNPKPKTVKRAPTANRWPL